MPDNPFENKAKQKLDELKFTPSDAVWLKVEAQIKKDKERRRLLLWVPLFGLFLGAVTWYFIPGKSKPHPEKDSIALSAHEKIKPAPSTGQPASLKKETLVSVEKDRTASNSSQPGKAKSGNGLSAKLPPDETNEQQKKTVLFSAKKRKMNANDLPARARTTAEEKNNQSRISGETSSGNESPVVGRVNEDNNKKDIVTNNDQVPGNADSAVQKKSAIATPVSKDSLKIAASKKTTPGKKNKLEWGIDAGFGLSSVSTKFIHEGYLYNAPYSAGSPPANYPTLPSDKQSVSFYFGLRVQKPLNKTTKIFSGIRYAYSGIKIARGNQINQPLTINAADLSSFSINSYYSVSGTGSYNSISHYHFLEIPLGIEKQFGQKSRFSVNAGVSIAWLVSSNALQYDPQTRNYFKDNSYFNKTQWNILGGIQYRLLQKEKYSLQIGPQVQYGLNSLLNKKSPYSEHLFFGGFHLLLVSNRK